MRRKSKNIGVAKGNENSVNKTAVKCKKNHSKKVLACMTAFCSLNCSRKQENVLMKFKGKGGDDQLTNIVVSANVMWAREEEEEAINIFVEGGDFVAANWQKSGIYPGQSVFFFGGS